MNLQDIKDCIALEEAGNKLEFRSPADPEWTERSVEAFLNRCIPEVSKWRIKSSQPSHPNNNSIHSILCPQHHQQ